MIVRLLGLLLGLVPGVAGGQPAFVYTASSSTVPYSPASGEAAFVVELGIVEEPTDPGFPHQTLGFAMGLIADGSLLTTVSLVPGPFLAPICDDGPEVFIVDLAPAGCDGATLGVVYGFLCDVFLSYPEPEVVALLGMETVSSTLLGDDDGEVTSLVWSSSCGSPPIANVVSVEGELFSASTVDGVVTLEPRVPFVRGDCNDSGVIDLGDGVFLLNHLFSSGPEGPCQAACDFDGDGVLGLVDGIGLFDHLFQNGPPPANPYPDCGIDGSAECEQFTGC